MRIRSLRTGGQNRNSRTFARPAVRLFRHRLFHAVLISLDHLLDHLAADGTGLTGGQIPVVALLQVDADFVGSLHLESVERLTRLRDDAGITALSHS